jgi:hypothetical protein
MLTLLTPQRSISQDYIFKKRGLAVPYAMRIDATFKQSCQLRLQVFDTSIHSVSEIWLQHYPAIAIHVLDIYSKNIQKGKSL